MSPDGKRLAYVRGLVEWNVLEIALPTRSVRTVLGGSGVVSWWPDWAHTGSHFLTTTGRSGLMTIEDVSTAEGFSRRLLANEPGISVINARWSPDATRIAFTTGVTSGAPQLRIATSTGGATILTDQNIRPAAGISWSPDSQWIAYTLARSSGIAIVRADSPGAPVVLVQPPLTDFPAWASYHHLDWSPTGNSIAYPTANGISLISTEMKATRLLTARKLQAFAFTRDGRSIFGIERDTTGKGPQWQLYQIDVATGADKLLGPVDLPATADSIAGFSIHPDGTRILTSIAKWPMDIWMLEGLRPPRSWFSHMLGR